MDYDVVVAGVGVAGAFTLHSLSDDVKAVGIDRRERLGYPVECGEIVPSKREMEKLLPDLDDHSIFEIPERFTVNRTKRFEFVLPNGKSIDVDFEMLVLNRDEMIRTVAEESGKELITGKRFDYRDGVVVDGERIGSRVVVASDGANSVIRRRMGIRGFELSPAKQYVMEGFEGDEDTIYMYVGKRICAGGYAWIIPKGNGIANVGVGFRHEFAERGDNIHRALDRFVREWPHSSEMLKRAEVVSKIGAVVPVDRPLERTVYGNVLFVGDSASMVISHVGAGIPTSMVAGKIAGEVVSRHIAEGLPLETYEREWRKRMLRAMENGYYIKKLWDRMAESDERVVRYFRLVSRGDLSAILRSRVPVKVRLAGALMPALNLFF
ncbi:geranylgeranyl reductase family protein [Geoglobus sp.]